MTPDRFKRWPRRLRWPYLTIAGVALLGATLLLEPLGIGSPGFGLVQIGLLIVGAVLTLLGWLGRRFAALYTGLALTLLNVSVLLGILEVGAVVVLGFRNEGPAIEDPILNSEYYATKSWGDRFLVETVASRQRAYYEPYTLWRRPAYAGETVSIDSSGLRTTPGAVCSPGAFTVFTFGGSTMWGVGAPDWGTIPAFLQVGLQRHRGTPVCVRNHGDDGFVSTQGVLKLMAELRDGRVPDLVVFYDGINDVITALDTGRPGVHYGFEGIRERIEDPPEERLLRRSRLVKLFGLFKSRPGALVLDSDSFAAAVVDFYLGNLRIVGALSREYGFDYLFIVQPVMTVGSKPLTAVEESLRAVVPAHLVDLFEKTYRRLSEAAEDRSKLHYFGRLFDQRQGQLYVDFGHLLPPANEIVADSILVVAGFD